MPRETCTEKVRLFRLIRTSKILYPCYFRSVGANTITYFRMAREIIEMTRNMSDTLICHIIRHPLTEVTIFALKEENPPLLKALCFGSKTFYHDRPALLSDRPDLLRYGEMISRFLDGRQTSLNALRLDLDGLSLFSRKVLTAARSIGWGKTVSYAELAAMAGNPGAVRAAASVMRNNRFPLVIPCHRVVRSDGSVGGFMGKQKGPEIALKRSLLENERR
jgi:O-6-methylguanine DNA methyltransferase